MGRVNLPTKQNLAVLLSSAAAGGTIAAVRHLAAQNIDVSVISSQRLGAAAWSRYAARAYSAPPESQGQQFLERLLQIGRADPGRILLPTSDETTWLYTENAAQLKQYFSLYQPPMATLQRILDKKQLADAAIAAGLAVLPSWHPRNIQEVAALAGALPYPVLIKPRTHVRRLRNDKGIVIESSKELVDRYRRFVDRERGRAEENPLLPEAGQPILQQFIRVGQEGVVSITGFIDRTGELFVTRTAKKVFQRSQPVGVGVCFESLPAAPVLSNAVRRLCRELGYFGMFEVEFLKFGALWAVIDFNPRLYNQVGMDIRRGMPLPLLVILDAAGETSLLREAVARAQAEDDEQIVFYDRFTLRSILLAQTLTARISREDRAYWYNWINRYAGCAVDFVADDSDPIPGVIHAFSEICLGLKALPRFMRSSSLSASPGALERELS